MHVFAAGEYLNIKVNGLRSSKTFVSYDYYSLPFPKVQFIAFFHVQPKEVISRRTNLGELLSVNAIKSSVYNVQLGYNQTCMRLIYCSYLFVGIIAGEAEYDEKDIEQFIQAINNEYVVELLVDNLPGKMEVRNKDGFVQQLTGFPVGGTLLSKETDRELGYALNNHLDFTIYLNDKEIRDVYTVVGFDITPRRYVFLSYIFVFNRN